MSSWSIRIARSTISDHTLIVEREVVIAHGLPYYD